MSQEENGSNFTGLEIAVIGMSGRFPAARDIDELWRNLKEGIDCTSFFSDQELLEAGVSEKAMQNPRYVKAFAWMDDIDLFDASFFDYTPVEAEIMDPQMRIFHECVHAALENAGYNSHTYQRPIGIYVGASASFLWQIMTEMSGKNRVFGKFAARLYNDKDALATRLAFRLNLKGPAVTLESACSTSLLAVHMACQGLICGDCDIAVAGGVTIRVLKKEGYLYQEGMIYSSDGHCRAFSDLADGSNLGNAAAVIVLKRLEDAQADNDTIHAVIRGSGINNDGSRKAAFTAPSVEGQAAAIRAAYQMAEVNPETIGYLETHGTGTALGDPVEIEGLKSAFNTSKKQFCAIGSIKTNLGHLEITAGVTGLIKTVLVLKHKFIPPSLYYETPNPKIDFSDSPFKVNTVPMPWHHENGSHPRRAGVSSFGIGGTNVHVVLEEAVTGADGTASLPESRSLSLRKNHLILLSARTETALETMTVNLAGHFRNHPGIGLADAAYTLQVGRQRQRQRRMLVCSGIQEAIEILSSPDSTTGKMKTHSSREDSRSVMFMFAGLGSQYVNMGRDLYEREPVFRREADGCFKILAGLQVYDIKEILYPAEGGDAVQGAEVPVIRQTEIAQMVIFVFEYALARLLMHWGIRPVAMIGYSFGEYVAACIAGVFSLEEALALVVHRGKLLQTTPAGAMLSVPLSPQEVETMLKAGNHGQLAIGIDNGTSCVVSGPAAAVDEFEKRVKQSGYMSMRVDQSRALHSPVMEAIAGEFGDRVRGFRLNRPEIPLVSNVTGQWLSGGEAVSPGYWVKHLTGTVRFAGGMKTLIGKKKSILVEIGPGRDLRTLALRYIEGEPQHRVLNLVRHPQQRIDDDYFLLSNIGRLWSTGYDIDWNGFHSDEKRKRIPLPTYPFEGQRYWIEKSAIEANTESRQSAPVTSKKRDLADFFYLPSWQRSPVPVEQKRTIPADSCWLVFIDDFGIGARLVRQLEREAGTVITVKAGPTFLNDTAHSFTVNPGEESDIEKLFNELSRRKTIPNHIVHLWNIASPDSGQPLEATANQTFAEKTEFHKALVKKAPVDEMLDSGYYALLSIARSIGGTGMASDIQVSVITNNMQEVGGGDGIFPENATVLGPVKVIPLEYKNIRCRNLDIVLPPVTSGAVEQPIARLVRQLLEDIVSGAPEQVVAYRGDYRWVQVFEPVRYGDMPVERVLLKQGGIYVITGGLGGIGLQLAGYLAKHFRARLVLIGRRELPSRDQWERLPVNPGKDEHLETSIRKVKELEETAGEVEVMRADVTDPEQMRGVFERVLGRFGEINGIIHCAGLADGEMIQRRTREVSARILAPKIQGTLVLDELITGMKKKPDFFMLCSSTAAILPMFGLVGYCSANAFLGAFAQFRNASQGEGEPMLTVSVDWDRWRGVGIANILEKQHKEITGQELAGGITGEQGVEAFRRVLADRQAQVVVANFDIAALYKQFPLVNIFSFMQVLGEKSAVGKLKPRPQLDSEYRAPANETEEALAMLWSKFFGYEQIGTEDDFFELGGDSLKAINMLNLVHKRFDALIPLPEFFNRATVRWLAANIDRAERGTFREIVPVEKKEYYLLSSAQKRLYILHRLEPMSIGYNLAATVLLEGETSRNELQESFRRLILRHESLRTSFHMVRGEPVQVIHDEVEFGVENFEIDRGGIDVLEETDNPNRKTAEVITAFVRPFDLSRAPLLRVALINLGTGRNILVVDMHHIIHDGISQSIFFNEFSALYRGEELLGLNLQYKDYAVWQRQNLEEKAIELQEEYWINQFSGEIPVLSLPYDYPRPVMQSLAGGKIGFAVGAEETKALRRLALAEDVTLFMLILCIYNVLLGKLSNQEDIVVGTPEAGRKHPDLQSIIGFFLNTLPLRNYPAAGKSFRVFLKEVKEHTLAAFANRDYSFEDLVERVVVNRDLSRSPLFDVMIIFHTQWAREAGSESVSGGSADLQELALKSYEYEKGTSEFDLTLIGFDRGDHLYFDIEYGTKLFKQETIFRFITYFNKILSDLPGNPGQMLHEIGIMPESEKCRLLYDFNATDEDYAREKLLHELIAEQVERTPDHVAVVGAGGIRELSGSIDSVNDVLSISYRRLDEKSGQLAGYLRTRGVGIGVMVGIMLQRSEAMIIGILAVLKAGGIYIPLDPEYPEARIAYIIEKSSTNFLLTQANLIHKSKQEMFAGEIIDFYSGAVWEFRGESINRSKTVKAERGPAYVIYTSGSTGNPKGVVITHRNAVNFIRGMSLRIEFSQGRVILALTTVSFDIFFLETLLPLSCGLRVVIADEHQQRDPRLLTPFIIKHCVDMVQFTPSRLQQMVSFQEGLPCLAGTAALLVGGEALPLRLLEKTRQSYRGSIYNVYGPTETTIWSTVKNLTHGSIEDLTIGKPIANTYIYIVNRYMRLQVMGVPGELLIGGDGVASGYLNNPLLTAEKFICTILRQRTPRNQKLLRGVQGGSFLEKSPPGRKRGNMYRTGDLAKWNISGEIEFLGRIDQQVKIRGFRVEIEEIEEQILKYKTVKEVVVVTRGDSGGDKSLCAYIVLEVGIDEELSVSELREFLSRKLPYYMVPSYFDILDRIPLTPNGKVNRRALPEPAASRDGLGSAYEPPDSEREKLMAGIWKELLQIERVGIHDNFFDLGGNSLKIIQLNQRVLEEFGQEIPVALMFRNLTIDYLVRYIDGEGEERGIGINYEKEIEIKKLEKDKADYKDAVSKLIGV